MGAVQTVSCMEFRCSSYSDSDFAKRSHICNLSMASIENTCMYVFHDMGHFIFAGYIILEACGRQQRPWARDWAYVDPGPNMGSCRPNIGPYGAHANLCEGGGVAHTGFELEGGTCEEVRWSRHGGYANFASNLIAALSSSFRFGFETKLVMAILKL